MQEQIQPKRTTQKLPAADRRRQIIQVAMALFSAKGFEGTTTREISRAAGVSEAIIFRHFATKEDLYAAIIDFIIQGHCETVLYGTELRPWTSATTPRSSRRSPFAFWRPTGKSRRCLRLLLFSSLEGHKLSQLFMESQVRPVYELLSGYFRERATRRSFPKGRCHGLGARIPGHGQSSFADSDDLSAIHSCARAIGKWPENSRVFLHGVQMPPPEGKGNDFFYGLRVILLEPVCGNRCDCIRLIIVALLPLTFCGLFETQRRDRASRMPAALNPWR